MFLRFDELMVFHFALKDLNPHIPYRITRMAS